MRSFATILIALIFGSAIAQDQIPMYKMGSAIGQSVNLNPAFIPDHKLVIGLPVLSSSYISINTDGSAIDDLVKVSNGQIVFDTAKLAENLKNINRFEIDGDVSLFFFGMKAGRNFFGVTANSRASADFNFPGDLLRLIILGNDDPRTRGKSINLENTYLKAQSFHELGLVYSRQVNRKLSVGGIFKFLRGINSIEFQGPRSQITASEDSISIISEAFDINTSGIVTSRTGSNYISGGNNYGYSLNLGVNYLINERMSVSGSVNDLGFIQWKEDTRTYRFDEVNYSFDGFDIFDFVGTDLNDEILTDETDSLKELFTPEKIDGESFRTILTARTYLGYNYQIHKKHSAGVIFYSDIVRGSIDPSIGLNYQLHLSIFDLVANWSYRNERFDNLGLGLSLNLGPIQIYGFTENIASAIRPAGSRRVDARLGLNISIKEKKPFN